MSDSPTGKREGQTVSTNSSPPLTHSAPNRTMQGPSEDEIRLIELWNIIWSGKWRILAIVFLFVMGSVAYALLATEWFRAEILLAPADAKGTPVIPGQLGGLASLAGVNVGGGDSIEAVATLLSRDFAREFIEDYELLTVFFANDWDSVNERWLIDNPRKQPDLRKAVRYFHENILRVTEDRGTGLVTLAIGWTDPDLAADWATALVGRLNVRLRERALEEAEINVAYLQQQLAQTNVVTLQQAVGRLLEAELQKLMLARGTQEFAFRVIDSAEPPDRRARPKRILVVLIGAVAGGAVALLWVFLGHALRT